MNRTFDKLANSANNKASQRGITMTSVMVILCVAVFVGMFAFKAAPAYFDNWTVMKVVSQVAADDQLMRGTRKAVYKNINTQFGHNNLWHHKAEDIVVLKKGATNSYVATVTYEKRENLFSNIDLVMRFDSEATP